MPLDDRRISAHFRHVGQLQLASRVASNGVASDGSKSLSFLPARFFLKHSKRNNFLPKLVRPLPLDIREVTHTVTSY